MKVADALKAISLYPINSVTIENIAEECELYAGDETSTAMRASSAFKKAQAKVYLYLAEAPDVTEGGIHFAFTDADRKRFANKAASILAGIGQESEIDEAVEVGWVGEDF